MKGWYFEDRGADYRHDYPDIAKWLNENINTEKGRKYLYAMGKTDLFFLMYFILDIRPINHPWMVSKIYEVQDNHDRTLDLWSRELFKSTTLTFALPIQELIQNPENRIVIFSNTRDLAKDFLRRIKHTLQTNQLLIKTYPDVFYLNPEKESPKWSENDGLLVRRKGSFAEMSLEAWGVTENMPTGRHFNIRIYDDLVTWDSTRTGDQINKTKNGFELSHALGVTEGGQVRVVGTRYDYNDLYSDLIKSGEWRVRIYRGDVHPSFWTEEQIQQKRIDYGIYNFSCHVAGTKILMSDWTEKPIENIKIGDDVIGFKYINGRTRLVKTKVLALNTRNSNVNLNTLESNTDILCTPDHQWWTGRNGHDGHKKYSTLGSGYGQINGLINMGLTKVPIINDLELLKTAHWLGGIFDGEGSVTGGKGNGNYEGGTIQLHQSQSHNPIVCEAIRKSLNLLEFDFGEHHSIRPKHGEGVQFYLKGGKEEKLKFVSLCDPVRKNIILDTLFTTKNGSYHNRDKIKKIIPIGIRQVFNIQTETGNYIANGYASKNCQISLDPVSEDQQKFQMTWINYHDGSYPETNDYIVVDPAGEKKEKSSYTVMWVLGVDGYKKVYVKDCVRDKLNLHERWVKLRDLVLKYPRILNVGYEKYSMQADIGYIKEKQIEEKVFFNIEPLGGAIKKDDRIRSMIPFFEQGRMLFPRTLSYTSVDGKVHDLSREFFEEEYIHFPNISTKDMMDCLARVADPNLKIVYPNITPVIPQKKQTANWFGNFWQNNNRLAWLGK